MDLLYQGEHYGSVIPRGAIGSAQGEYTGGRWSLMGSQGDSQQRTCTTHYCLKHQVSLPPFEGYICIEKKKFLNSSPKMWQSKKGMWLAPP
jgi:hypothetical protein